MKPLEKAKISAILELNSILDEDFNEPHKDKKRTGIVPDALFGFIWLILLCVKTSSVLPNLPEVRFWGI